MLVTWERQSDIPKDHQPASTDNDWLRGSSVGKVIQIEAGR